MNDLKYNINKIHSNLQEKFENVSIKELSNRKWGNYFEIEVNERYLVRMILPVKELYSNGFKWFYSSNPNSPKSDIVERTSQIENISSDVKDLLDNKRFSVSYIKNN